MNKDRNVRVCVSVCERVCVFVGGGGGGSCGNSTWDSGAAFSFAPSVNLEVSLFLNLLHSLARTQTAWLVLTTNPFGPDSNLFNLKKKPKNL